MKAYQMELEIHLIKNEEEISNQRKDWKHFAINIFTLKFNELNKTIYSKIILDHILFSSYIEYEDLERFMDNKLNFTPSAYNFKASNEGNQVKYALTLLKEFILLSFSRWSRDSRFAWLLTPKTHFH